MKKVPVANKDFREKARGNGSKNRSEATRNQNITRFRALSAGPATASPIKPARHQLFRASRTKENSSLRVCTPVLVYTWRTCDLAVLNDTHSSCEI